MKLNKRSIAQHEECHKNYKIYLQEQIEKINRLQTELNKSQKDWDKREKQINKAKQLGLTEFDEEQTNMKNL